MWNIEELKEEIKPYEKEYMADVLGMSEEEVIQKINATTIDKSIEVAPDLMAHCSVEQLVYRILY